jgi:hypothetical protein
MAKKNEEDNVKAKAEHFIQEVKQEVKTETVKTDIKSKFSLPNTKVHVKPILRKGVWLPEGHSGHFMYDNTQIGIMVPIDRLTGRLKNPLTPAEQEYFETQAGLDFKPGDLNPYKEKSFWTNFKITVRKVDSIVSDKTVLLTLDLSNPLHYLQYKVLLANSQPDGGLVAPSWEERENSGTYRIVLVHEGQQHADKAKKADKMKAAYKYLSKIDSSTEAMFDFLTVYYLENAKSKRPSLDSGKDYYYSEIQDLIDNDLDGVIDIIQDADNYEYKLLVHRGLKINALKMVGNRIETADGIPIGNSLYQAVQWFKDDRHQDEYLRLKNQIELAK